MEKEQPTKRKKIAKGKTWFTLHAPKVFNENAIGETLGKDAQSLVGRTIDMPLSEVIGDVTKHHIKLKLRIINVTGEHANTEIVSYELSKPYTQRMIRRKISKLDVVCDVKLKDDKYVRIKIVGITLAKANSSKTTSLRREIAREVSKEFQNFDLDSLVVMLSTGRMQREIQKKLSKIYPLRFLEIRKVEPSKESNKGKTDLKETKTARKKVEKEETVENEEKEEITKEEIVDEIQEIEDNTQKEQPVEETTENVEDEQSIDEEENIA
jgi:small subunit ribosomal protein S3Ae